MASSHWSILLAERFGSSVFGCDHLPYEYTICTEPKPIWPKQFQLLCKRMYMWRCNLSRRCFLPYILGQQTFISRVQEYRASVRHPVDLASILRGLVAPEDDPAHIRTIERFMCLVYNCLSTSVARYKPGDDEGIHETCVELLYVSIVLAHGQGGLLHRRHV
jgi:hypothetical protein